MGNSLINENFAIQRGLLLQIPLNFNTMNELNTEIRLFMFGKNKTYSMDTFIINMIS